MITNIIWEVCLSVKYLQMRQYPLKYCIPIRIHVNLQFEMVLYVPVIITVS